MHTRFQCGNLKERDNSEDLDEVGISIKIGLKEIARESVKWIHLAQNGDNWRALVNTTPNFVTSTGTQKDFARWT